LAATNVATYKPGTLASRTLGSIADLIQHPKTVVITTAFATKKFLCKLPGGQIYFDSGLDLDTDGSRFFNQDGPPGALFGVPTTSTKWADGTSLDADVVNYFVLPGGFYTPYNIEKGDIGVVIFGSRKVFACFGDVGPTHKLGEGSISLHRELGNEPIANHNQAKGEHLINGAKGGNGIGSGVVTIVFPGSGNGFGKNNHDSQTAGSLLFDDLKREAEQWTNSPAPGPGGLAA